MAYATIEGIRALAVAWGNSDAGVDRGREPVSRLGGSPSATIPSVRASVDNRERYCVHYARQHCIPRGFTRIGAKEYVRPWRRRSGRQRSRMPPFESGAAGLAAIRMKVRAPY